MPSRACIVALAIVRIQRHKAHADFERQLRELYGPLVCKATIPDSVMVSVACSHHMTVGEYAPASPAAVALERLVKELTHGQSAWTQNSECWPQRSQAKQTASRLTTRPTARRTARAGGLRATRPRARKGRLKAGEKVRGCKFSIPESVFERLYQTARKRKTNMSILAGEILDRNLPYFDVIQRDKPPAAE